MAWSYCRNCNGELDSPDTVSEKINNHMICPQCQSVNGNHGCEENEGLIEIIEQLTEDVNQLKRDVEVLEHDMREHNHNEMS